MYFSCFNNKKRHIQKIWKLALFYLQNVFTIVKIFLQHDSSVTTSCETQGAWENLFFTVPIIKLRMFGGYISIIGAFAEAKTQVISICTSFSDFSN